jgi:hypothetical protein
VWQIAQPEKLRSLKTSPFEKMRRLAQACINHNGTPRRDAVVGVWDVWFLSLK